MSEDKDRKEKIKIGGEEAVNSSRHKFLKNTT